MGKLFINIYEYPPMAYLKRMRGQEPLKKKKQANLKIKWGQTPAFFFVDAFYSLRCPTHQVKWQR
jgi:hypothetical protein